jgi:hypothetical protein
MEAAKNCVVCEGAITSRRHGLVAPFLARRIWDRPSFGVELVRCGDCGFIFFDPRLDAAEESRLYAGYRLQGYQRMRQESEPWYTPKFNAALSGEPFMQARRATLASMLAPRLAGIRNPKILDFGGDRGELISGIIPGSSPFVWEISGVEPLEGVRACRDLDECKEIEFDLILCSNVLEHVGLPRNILQQIRQIATPRTLIFLEVPFESPFGTTLIARRLAQIGILAITRPGIVLQVTRPGFLYMMHEHINYFDSRSINTLVASAGGTVLESGTYRLKGPGGTVSMGWSLGRFPEPA